jgi:flagellar hook-associated protein 3 FlgL
MRISDRMLTDTVRTDLQNGVQNLSVLQHELATGKRINLPSDDPTGTAMAMRYSTELAANTEAQRVGTSAKGRLDAADASLNSLDNVLQRARELAVQAAGGTLSASDQASIASEVNQLANEAIQLGNTNYSGTYIFGGTLTTTPPFAATGGQTPTSVTYNGNATPITLGLGGSASVQVDAPGNQSFQPAINALIALRNGLTSSTPQASASASIATLDTSLDAVQAQRGTVGARTNGLTTLMSQLTDQNTNLTSLSANITDADITDVIVRLNSAQNVYQAALGAAAKVVVPSLADFLH